MKKKLVLLLSALALPLTLHAESIVESNVSIALKLYYNFDEPVSKGSTTIIKHQTIAIKNADLVEAVNKLIEGDQYPLKSPIICRQFFDASGNQFKSAVYLLRDKKLGELDITHHFGFFPTPVKVTSSNVKSVEGLSTGTINYIQMGVSVFIVNPGVQPSESFQLQGVERISAKLIVNRKNTELVKLISLKSAVTGIRSGLPPLESLAEGTAPVEGSFKISGAKIVNPLPSSNR